MLHTKYQSSAPASFRKEDFKNFPCLLLCFKPVTPGAGPVLTPGASFEQTCWRSTRRCHIPNIKAICLQVSEEKIFKVFLLCSYAQTCDPQGGASFDPRDIIWTNLVEVHYDMLHTKYQSSSFREEDFQRFRFFFLLLPWQPELWVELNSLNNFGRASPKEHSCQVSWRLALWFWRRCLKKLLTDVGYWAITIAHL